MKRQELITEELNRGRLLMGLKPLTFKSNIMEQVSNASQYHEWEDCSNQWMQSGIRYWDRASIDAAIAEYGSNVAGANGSSPVSSNGWYMGAPSPYNIATQNPNNGTLQPYATHQNSEAFWIAMGSPTPGTTLKYTMGGDPTNGIPGTDFCINYLGPVSVPSTGNHSMTMGTMAYNNIVGPYQDCQMCQLGVLTTFTTFNCNNGNCSPVQGTGGTYPDLTSCQAACTSTSGPDMYRCHDCTTPCTQTVVDAGYCPYTTTQDCQDQCSETSKWTCGRSDKFGNPRCRKCKEFELWDGTTCYNTQQMCLDSCEPRKELDQGKDIYQASRPNKKKGGDLPQLDQELGDKKYLEQLISSMQSVDEFISWFDGTYGPFRKAGADIPTGKELISNLEGSKGRMSEQGLPVWMGILGGIFGLITGGIKAWQSTQDLCCPDMWCCAGKVRPNTTGNETGETMGESKIRIKESDITNIVRKLIQKR
tara:strand:+ start:97 stop:1527 length:1431 start_codon:yes stop_codon:yes gene_type:complete